MTTVEVSAYRDLAAAVRAVRIEQGISQTELAQDARISRQWLVGFEAGDKASAPLDMLWRLITVLGMTVSLAPTPPELPREPDPVIDLAALIDGRLL